jgi:hypothetical protein
VRLRRCPHCKRTRPASVARCPCRPGWGARGSDPNHPHHAWAKAVKERDGHQCVWVDERGARCPARAGPGVVLYAHHLVPDSYAVEHGATLCAAHHAAADPNARAPGRRASADDVRRFMAAVDAARFGGGKPPPTP